MNLELKINEGMKESIKSSDKARLETLRLVRAKIIEFNKSGIGREMTEEDEYKILKAEIKKCKEAIEFAEKAGRKDLAQKYYLKIVQRIIQARCSL